MGVMNYKYELRVTSPFGQLQENEKRRIKNEKLFKRKDTKSPRFIFSLCRRGFAF